MVGEVFTLFYFLLVINSNLSPILPRLRDTAGFPRKATPPLFHPNFRGVPLRLDCRCCGSRSEDPKLITRLIIFKLTQHTRKHGHGTSTSRTDGQTDGQTDGRTTYDSNTALVLRASVGKNRFWSRV